MPINCIVNFCDEHLRKIIIFINFKPMNLKLGNFADFLRFFFLGYILHVTGQ